MLCAGSGGRGAAWDVQANATGLEDLGVRMTSVEEVLKTLVAKIDALTPQREGKGVMTMSFSGEESSEEKEGEKSTIVMKTGERSLTGP
ncbi:unnamed protein product [Linum trigynum]|uniref:Uncharacterized protein n=1 Tax=Linum trigynum TaxID=586398 RepID=A0AAV2FQG4_9ROSI